MNTSYAESKFQAFFFFIILAYFSIFGALQAAEPPSEQVVILPINEFLKRIGGGDDWNIIPLSQYRELCAAWSKQKSRMGAWIESAVAVGVIGDDECIQMHAILTVIATGPTQCCPIFSSPPEFRGLTSLDGKEALTVAAESEPQAGSADTTNRSSGVSLALPDAGRHVVVLDWSSAEKDDGNINIPLPLSAVLELRIRSTQPGKITCDDLRQYGDESYRLINHVNQLTLHWQQGEQREATSIFGMTQKINFKLQSGQRQFSWSGHWDIRQGTTPPTLDLTLPIGWIPIAPEQGATSFYFHDNQIHLLCSPASENIGFHGYLSNEAGIALADVHQALWDNGEVTIVSDRALDIHPPPSWVVLDPDSDHGIVLRYGVPGPDLPTQINSIVPIRQFGCNTSAWLLLGPERYILDQFFMLTPGIDQYKFQLHIPDGWQISTLTLPDEMIAPDVTSVRPGSMITIISPHGSTGKTFWKIHAIMERKSSDHFSLIMASIPEATEMATRLGIVCGPGLDLHVAPLFPWQTASPNTLTPLQAFENSSNLVQLVAATSPTPIPIEIVHHSLSIDTELVYNVVPNGSEYWSRIDMRLLVSDGEIQDLIMEAPWFQANAIQVSSPWTITLRADGKYLLHAAESWHGVRLLRLEGAMKYANGHIPIINIYKVDNSHIDVQKTMIISQNSSDSFEIVPGPSAHVIDNDQVPSWSNLIPSTTIIGVFHIDGDEPGHVIRIDRPVANGPNGFIDQLVLRTQIDQGSSITDCHAILAAPGLSTFAFNIKSSQHLISATIDGRSAMLRRDGDHVTVSLPGRTQVELSLQFSEDVDSHHPFVHVPRFVGIPVTRSSWYVSVAGKNLIKSVINNSLMPLRLHHVVSESWIGQLKLIDESDIPHESPRKIVKNDERRLPPHEMQKTLRGQPILILSGVTLSGERVGIADMQLDIMSLESCQYIVQILLVLCLILGIVAGLLIRYLFCFGLIMFAISAVISLYFLSGFQSLISLSIFGFVPGAILGMSIVWILGLRRLWLKRSITGRISILLLAIGLSSLFCSELFSSESETISPSVDIAPTVVLMGYHNLDVHQLPQGVVVALTKERFNFLSMQGTNVDSNGLYGMACGAMRYNIFSTNGHLQGSLTFPLIVFSENWQVLHLDVGDSMISDVKVSPLGAVSESIPAKQLTWSMNGHRLSLNVKGKLSALIQLTLGWNRISTEQGWILKIPGNVSGGNVNIELPEKVQLHVGSNFRAPDSISDKNSRWIIELPPADSQLMLSAITTPTTASSEIVNISHVTTVRMLPTHFEWQDELSIKSHGELNIIHITIPKSLTVTRVAGDGIRSWHQDSDRIYVYWSHVHSAENQFTVSIYGVMLRNDEVSSIIMLASVADAKEHGRLRLINGDDDHFDRPQGLELSPSLPGEDIAAIWNDPPTTAMATVKWHSVSKEMRATERSALMIGGDRNRMALHISFSGSGRIPQIRIPLLMVWSLVSCEVHCLDGNSLDLISERQSFIGKSSTGREVVIRPNQGISPGETFDLSFVMSRTDFSEDLLVPNMDILGDGLSASIQTIVVGDCGEPRVEIPESSNNSDNPIIPFADNDADLLPPGFHIRPDEHLRFSCQLQPMKNIILKLSHDAPIIQCNVHQFLRVDNKGLRTSLLVEAVPQQGTVQEMHLLLPPTATLHSILARDLGWWKLNQGILTVHFAGSSRVPVHCIIDFNIPWSDNQISLDAMANEDGQGFGIQKISVAISDELPLVKINASGLERDDLPSNVLPLHIDGSLLTEAYHSTRNQWKLVLKRSEWSKPASTDGVVTFLDIHTVIAPNGESRSQALWSVINQSENQLAFYVPDEVDLWKIRVNGNGVTIRQDLKNKNLQWITVPRGRDGDASTSINVIWRQKATDNGYENLIPPIIQNIQIVKCIWGFSSSIGMNVHYLSGTLQACHEVDATLARSNTVMDDLHRIRSLENLNPRAMARLNIELQRIDAELDDEEVTLQNLNDHGLDLSSREKGKIALDQIQKTREQDQQELRRLQSENIIHEHRKTALGFDQTSINWPEIDLTTESIIDSGPVWSGLPLLPPSEIPWRDARLDRHDSLGRGQVPPGVQSGMGATLLGIDLVPEEISKENLILSGSGQDLHVRIRIQGERRNVVIICMFILSTSIVASILMIILGRRKRSVFMSLDTAQ